jgi:hypothetical protein
VYRLKEAIVVFRQRRARQRSSSQRSHKDMFHVCCSFLIEKMRLL